MKTTNINIQNLKSVLIAGLIAITAVGCGSGGSDSPDTPDPVNSAPQVTSASNTEATEGVDYSYTFTATDADGDTLTLSATTLPAWLNFDASGGVLSGMPSGSDVGGHDVTLSVTDGTDSTSQSFTITVEAAEPTNSAPVITSSSITAATEAVEYSYTLTATDADDDTITMSGSLVPTWLTFDSATGILSGTPANGDVGDHPVTLTVNDGTVDVNQGFTISVEEAVQVNNAPIITSTPVNSAVQDTEYQYTLIATDADGDNVTLTAPVLPAWLSFDGATGILSGTPLAEHVGEHAVGLAASDGEDEAVQDFNISVSETAVVAGLVIFEDAENPLWQAWDCCGGSTPTIETDDAEHGATVEFSIGAAATVMGFTSREGHGVVGGLPFDATAIAAEGTIVFDLKMTGSPGDTDWKFKIESNDGAQAVEVNLSTSNEAHAAPVLDTWQHYSFNLASLEASGLDMSAIDVIMIFPAWDTGNGAVYRVDNVKFLPDGGDIVEPPVASELTIFEDEENVLWPAWDCCGGSLPTVETDDAEHGATVEFSIGAAATVMGFTSREGHGVVDGVPFNATGIATEGTIVFDLKMTASPGDTAWKFKIESSEGATAVEVDLSTSNEGHAAPVLDTWQQYTFNIADLVSSGLDASTIDVIMIFPAWDTGNGAVYRVDNVKFLATGADVPSGSQVDLPITFDEVDINYAVDDFGGNSTVIGVGPAGSNGLVAITTKTDSAETWAGTTMTTPDGLATVVPLSLTNSIMQVRVYSPDAGIAVRLKIEQASDVTHTVETEAVTTTSNAWEVLTFDFTNEAPGTEPLNPTLHPDWIFDKPSIFFNFGVDGATAGEKVYYWDDIIYQE